MQEQQTGKIIKVAGPLVVASGMQDAKMYEVVKVSDKKLVGEIIKLVGDNAYIQVYEETSGIGPGEPVYLTNKPLTVDLGPGLLESIYDGVQRPLNKIYDQAGDYITRGIDLPGLDQEKEWEFLPKVKKGDKINPGDIIGTVQETSLIEHKIMVPLNISGTVIEIVPAGKYKISHTLCFLKNTKITMAQTWPIREPRPILKKLIPSEPLISGQRVIDAFFPIVKGGAGCVPGPFGAGKCVSADTKIVLANGEIHTIRSLFNKHKNKGKMVIKKHEEYTVLDKPLEILSYIDGKVIKNIATSVYKGKTNKLIKIITRSGKKIRITPVHKLFTADKNLNILEKTADCLKTGDYLIAPRVLPIKGRNIAIKISKYLPNSRIADQKVIIKVAKLIQSLSSRYGTMRNVSKMLKIKYHNLITYKLQRSHAPVKVAEKIAKLSRVRLSYNKVKGARDSKAITIPKYLNKDMAEYLGLLYGDGMIKNNTVRFYNNDDRIQMRFKLLSKKLFNLSSVCTIHNTVKTQIICSSVLAELIRAFGYPEYKKSRTSFVPLIILRAEKNIIAKFLGACFLTNGYFGTREVELATSSKEMATGLSYLLYRLGILNRLAAGKSRGFQRFRIFISGKSEIACFYKYCNLGAYRKFAKIKEYVSNNKKSYNAKDIVPLCSDLIEDLYDQAGRPYRKLERAGINIHNYIGRNSENLSRAMFQLLASAMKDSVLHKFAFNHLGHIFYDKITDVKAINKTSDVYDLEVPRGHNFVGGNSPVFLHNTVIQHQLAKWSDADIVIFIGCGERGNEMTDVLQEFPELKDPKSGQPLMKRTVLIANTSNMPVAAREASVYTGITIAEYFRDMGYKVLLTADSTSRWAEAMREISGRLEEMPGEEGYPAYLGSRTAAFYERAGYVRCLASQERHGSLTVVGAVSPPGGDLSEPVTQNTLRVTKVFWGLDASLAYKRHFPAINWLTSYSLYYDKVNDFMKKQAGEDWPEMREKAMSILQKESELQEIVRLVGIEALSLQEQLLLDTAKSIREDFLQQNAFDEIDAYTSVKKTYLILKIILEFQKAGLKKLKQDIKLEEILKSELKNRIAKAKMIKEENLEELEKLVKEIHESV